MAAAGGGPLPQDGVRPPALAAPARGSQDRRRDRQRARGSCRGDGPLVLSAVPHHRSSSTGLLLQKQKVRERSRSSRRCGEATGVAALPPPFLGWFLTLCFSFRVAGLPGAETEASSRGWNDTPRREGRHRAGSLTPEPAPVPRTGATLHLCSTQGCTGHRQAPGARAADELLAGLPALGTHLRQGPPVHVGAAQVDMPSVHDPEFGVQNAPGELP